MSKRLKYIEKEGLVSIRITINLENWGNLERFSSGFQITNDTAKRFGKESIKHVEIPLYNLQSSKKNDFNDYIWDLLTEDINPKLIKTLDINRQIEELIFIADDLSKIWIQESISDRNDLDFEIFDKLMTVLNAQSDIKIDDDIKITFLQQTAENNKTIELPKAENTIILFKYISDAIYRYYADTAKTFGLKWYLFNGYKEPRTLILMNAKLNSLKNNTKIDEDTLTARYIMYLLPYLRLLPQFPPHKGKRLTIITGSQAKFIDKFFTLFGLYKHSIKINLQQKETFKSPKQLRRLLDRYLKNSGKSLE